MGLRLDYNASSIGFTRKVSLVKTDECPVWNALEGLYMESDEQFRERIKKSLNGNDDWNT